VIALFFSRFLSYRSKLEMAMLSGSMIKLFCAFLIVNAVICSQSYLMGRQWTSSDGKFRVEAEFVAVRSGKVVLEKKNGEIISVPVEKLSNEDLAYIEGKTGVTIERPKVGSTKSGSTKAGSKNSDPEDLFSDSDSEESETQMTKLSESNSGTPSATEGAQTPALIQPIKLKGEKETDPSGVARVLPKGTNLYKAMTFSPDGAYLLVSMSNNSIAAFDVNNAKLAMVTPEYSLLGEIPVMRFTDNGKLLLTGSGKGVVVVWMVSKTGQLQSVGQFPGHTSAITSLAIAKDNDLVISGSGDKKARIWRIEDGKEIMSIDFENQVAGVWIDPDGEEALATDGAALIKVDLKTKRTTSFELAKFSFFTQATFSRDGKMVAIKNSSEVKVLNAKNGNPMSEVKSTESIQCFAFSPDGRKLLTGERGVVSVWDPKDGSRLEVIPTGLDTYLEVLAYSPDNWHFAVSGSYTPIAVMRMGRK
jgi:WD40 repeat protein